MKEAMLYEKKEKNLVKCNLCERRCVIKSGAVGYCRVRKNVDGKLYSLVYDKIVSANPDPIQKKPLFHFAPGSSVLSISTPGCNFRCDFCCNWVISQKEDILGEAIPPEELVKLAIKLNCQGISYTYTEPTIFFEIAYDTSKIAKENGLFNTFVTNGYMTPEAIKEISPYLDAATVDFKGSGNREFYKKHCAVSDVEPIYESLKVLKEERVFIEITNLVIPQIGEYKSDLKNLCDWIVENLGEETPFHLLAFFPSYKINNIPRTSIQLIDESVKIALNSSLKHVYSGNVPGHRMENTYCPSCGSLVIKRYNVYLEEYKLNKSICPYCGYKLNIIEI
ncbi:MAG: AmmeMemoRadiSam system radical SAM enzyme [Candidatus Odinarchaeia archaeon]